MAVRLDVWLWSVRFFKTRSAANKAVAGGHVRLNGAPVKPAHVVVVGDLVTIKEPGWERKYEVILELSKRVGAPVAQSAYLDKSGPKPEYLKAGPVARRDRGTGRPTKKDRREIDRLVGRREAPGSW